MRLAVDFVMSAHGIHHTSDGIAAVEQGRGAFEDLEPLQAGGIEGLTVIAGLGGQGTDPDPILHHQDTVTVKAADYWTRAARPETSLGHTGSAVQNVAQSRCVAPGQVGGVQGGY